MELKDIDPIYAVSFKGRCHRYNSAAAEFLIVGRWSEHAQLHIPSMKLLHCRRQLADGRCSRIIYNQFAILTRCSLCLHSTKNKSGIHTDATNFFRSAFSSDWRSQEQQHYTSTPNTVQRRKRGHEKPSHLRLPPCRRHRKSRKMQWEVSAPLPGEDQLVLPERQIKVLRMDLILGWDNVHIAYFYRP